MLNQIPRPLLVFLVLVIGVGFFFVAQEPHSVCTSQLPVFQENQAGYLFPKTTKTAVRSAIYPRLVDNCKIGNSSGACYEYFDLLKKLVRDLHGSPEECLVPFGELPEVKKALTEGPQLLVQLAWGDKPPDPGLTKLGWLEATDVALYCQLKTTYLKIYGNEEWDNLRVATNQKLPGEAEFWEEGKCLNCEGLKKAPAILSTEEIWLRSLYSVRCEQYF